MNSDMKKLYDSELYRLQCETLEKRNEAKKAVSGIYASQNDILGDFSDEKTAEEFCIRFVDILMNYVRAYGYSETVVDSLEKLKSFIEVHGMHDAYFGNLFSTEYCDEMAEFVLNDMIYVEDNGLTDTLTEWINAVEKTEAFKKEIAHIA